MRRKYKTRIMNKQKKIIVISICSLLLIMTVGYAAMQTNLEIKAKGNVIKKATGGNAILNSTDIVTSGDGLYEDAYEENVYTYRGSNPNNYIEFNNELWRIISVNTNDNSIKIIKIESLGNLEYDSAGYRPQVGYCNYSNNYGCNIWGSNSTLYDVNINPITELAYLLTSAKYKLPSLEAKLNTYLNNDYYNTLTSESQNMIDLNAIYKVGVLKEQTGQTLETDLEQVEATNWKGKVALIDATEYIRASTDSGCINVYNGSLNNSNYPCKNSNWMHTSNFNWWTISPYLYGASYAVWLIRNSGFISNHLAYYAYGVRPVVTLSPKVKITGGNGTINNGYTFEI